MPWHYEQIGMEDQTMVTLRCSAAERLLREYLRAIHDSNKATRDYARALNAGPPAHIRSKAKIATDLTERLRAARESFQLHRRRHRC